MIDIQTTFLFMLCLVIAYLIGDISPAILFGKAYGIDIKKEGSGNAGTTNALRVLGKKAAFFTLLIDIGKGAAAVFLGRFFSNYLGGELALTLPLSCAIAVFCGHIWPAFFGFRGGKGVATAFGAITAVLPALGFSLLGIVLLVVLLTRRVSAGSVCGAVMAPVITYFLLPQALWGISIMAIIVIIKHRSNIRRLVRGEEPKLSFRKKESGRNEK